MKRGRELWIDVSKGIAILSVIYQHVSFIRLQFFIPVIHVQALFAVPWFIFLAGITSVLSTGTASYLTYWRKKLPIVGMYLLASIFSSLLSGVSITPANILLPIVFFSASPPYYFFFILFQLFLMFPLFSEILKRIRFGIQFFVVFVCICFVGWYLSRITYDPWLIAGWNMLLGGTYAPIFFLGIAYARWQKQIHPFIKIPAVSIFLIFEIMLIVTQGSYFNRSPIITLFSWTLAFLFIVKMVIEALPNFSKFWRVLAFLGKHSLPIFLFHYVVIQKFASILAGNWIYFIFLFLLGVGVPLLIEYVLSSTLRGIVNVKKAS